MLRRLRRGRRFWAAVAASLMAIPGLFSGVAAAPSPDGAGSDLVPEPEVNPLEGPPADMATALAALALSQAERIADIAPPQYHTLVITAASRYRLDPRLIAAVITVETEWDPHAVGGHGELGLMQIMPKTGAWLAGLAGLEAYDLADLETSVDLGAMYLYYLIKEYDDPLKALAVYNGGPRAAENWQTNMYVQKVLRAYTQSSPPRPLALAS